MATVVSMHPSCTLCVLIPVLCLPAAAWSAPSYTASTIGGQAVDSSVPLTYSNSLSVDNAVFTGSLVGLANTCNQLPLTTRDPVIVCTSRRPL